jgi:hypothetical protein
VLVCLLIGILHTLGKSEMTLNHEGATINQAAINDIIGNDGRDITSSDHKDKGRRWSSCQASE